MKKHIIVVTVLSGVLLLGASSLALARGGNGMGPQGAGPIAGGPCYGGSGYGPGPMAGWFAALTDDQQKQVADLFQAQRKSQYAQHLKLRAKRAELNVALVEDKIDEGRVKGLVMEVNTMRNQIFSNRIAFQMKLSKEFGAPVALGGMGRGMGYGHGYGPMMGRGFGHGYGPMTGRGYGMGYGPGMMMGPDFSPENSPEGEAEPSAAPAPAMLPIDSGV